MMKLKLGMQLLVSMIRFNPDCPQERLAVINLNVYISVASISALYYDFNDGIGR